MSHSTTIDVPESSAAVKGKAPLMVAAGHNKGGGFARGLGILDFILRIGALISAIAAAAAMGTSEEDLPLFTQFAQFSAGYDDFDTFTFFVIAMAMVAAYLVLSLPLSIVTIVRPSAGGPRFLLLVLDTVTLTLNTAAGAAAASIVYLAHNGNPNTNWLAICNQYQDFCRQTSGSVVGAFVSVILFVMLIVLSAVALQRH